MNASEAECIFGHELTAHRRLCLAGGVRFSERKGEARRFAGGKGRAEKEKTGVFRTKMPVFVELIAGFEPATC